MQEISTASFAALRSDVDHIRKTVDDLASTVKPIALARSGDLALVSNLRRDLDHSHDKHREHFRRFDDVDKRIDALELRFNRFYWMAIGIWAAIQVAWAVWGDALRRALSGGGG